jgi:hypothetical protein
MKNEIVIPVLRQEDFVAANKRRDTYALTRDVQAMETNAAIAERLLTEIRNQTKCEKCGKAFSAGITTESPQTCPDCK